MSDLIKRLGRFRLNRNFIHDEPENALKILDSILIVDIRYDFTSNSMNYVGYSKHFDIVEDNTIPPKYNIEIEPNIGEIKWRREGDFSEQDVKGMLGELKNEISKAIKEIAK